MVEVGAGIADDVDHVSVSGKPAVGKRCAADVVRAGPNQDRPVPADGDDDAVGPVMALAADVGGTHADEVLRTRNVEGVGRRGLDQPEVALVADGKVPADALPVVIGGRLALSRQLDSRADEVVDLQRLALVKLDCGVERVVAVLEDEEGVMAVDLVVIGVADGRGEADKASVERTAEERFDFLGKAKLWYVVSAEPGAKLFLGFKNDVASSDFYSACQDGSVEGLLNVVEPSAGDHFFISPGTVHCAGKGLEIAEISESSPLDFRLFDWGRKGELDPFDAELSLEEAFDFIDYRAWKPADALAVRDDKGSLRLTDNKEFTAAEIRLSEVLHVSCSDFGSFIAYLCISGEASIQIPADPESGRKDLETYLLKKYSNTIWILQPKNWSNIVRRRISFLTLLT